MLSLATDPGFALLLADSYERLVGKPLLPTNISAADAARWLYQEAPFVVVSHNTDDDPRFVYGNLTAQRCFEYDWDEFTTLRSRLSAEPPNRDERDRLLDDVRTKGYSSGYRGLRIAKSGRRFWIEEVTVWNMLDREGVYCGQAATYAHWSDA